MQSALRSIPSEAAVPGGAARQRLHGAGLGLRRGQLSALQAESDGIDFFEVAPENWIDVGGKFGRAFRALTERIPLVCHGLSLSLGGPDPIDEVFVERVARFLKSQQAALYSEHLSACTDGGHLYDLMPLPFTETMVRHVADRIARVQDRIGARMAVENSSYYTPLRTDLRELDFVNAVLERADCLMLLDVNNVYVNSVNHGYDAKAFIAGIPSSRIAYLHVAGHDREAPDFIVDTHGAAVDEAVWQLLEFTYRQHGRIPTLLERDFNLPPLAVLKDELSRTRALQGSAHDQSQTARA